ncbi:uncharacterized protein LOC141788211 [Halichoeres trimaculatus]|uniref:uncharacterized protein LOC141788211 n=1 Tax=Halichoeres trimaculatus TaxID=147232 RepID=UPI003D9E55EC
MLSPPPQQKQNSMLPFAIVEFENQGLAVIATKWFIGPEEDECYWPPSGINLTKAIIEQKDPQTDWEIHKLTVKRKAATYEVARTKLVQYEEHSDVPTESEENMGRGKRRRRPVVMSSEDEDDDDQSSIPIRPTPQSTLRSSPPPPPPICRPVPTPPPPPSTLRSVHTPPSPSAVLSSSSKLPPPAIGSSPPPPHCYRRGPSASHHATMSPESPRTQIRDNMFIRILTLLEEIKEMQKIHGRILQTLVSGKISTTPYIPEGFPLKTINDVKRMEENLGDADFMSKLVAAVADIGGATVDEATRRMMSFLLDHGLSRQYNFVGRNGKREFKVLKLFEVIYGALKKNAMTSQITRKDAEKAVAKWLIGARDRGGNRQARQTQQATPQQGLQASDLFDVENE